MNPTDKIDAVITWVDGNDPVHQAKRAQYLTHKREDTRKDVAGETRFNQVGEIYYCIASILRFAPWINKIYIVTDNQDPKVNDFINKHFPENKIPVEIVDHKVIFKGYEKYLPTFNSLSIESMMWRIPGLSERFIYFNDDVVILHPVSIGDFFVDNKIVLHGKRWISVNEAYVTLNIQTIMRRIIGKEPLLSFKKFMYNAAQVANVSRFIRLRHVPHPFFKSVLDNFYEENPQYLVNNICHRFRNKNQYNTTELHHLLALKQGKVKLPFLKNQDVIISPFRYDSNELKDKLTEITRRHQNLYFCVNSLDQSSEEQIRIVNDWLQDNLSIQER